MRCAISTSILQSFLSQEQQHLREAFDPADLIASLTKTLEQKARNVVSARAGLSGEKRVTLSQIGQELHLSRERIRQIERDATLRLSDRLHEQHNTAISFITASIDAAGGVVKEDDLIQAVLIDSRRTSRDVNAFRLFLRLTKDLVEIKDSQSTYTGWVLRIIDTKSVLEAVDAVRAVIETEGKVVDFATIWAKLPQYHRYPESFLQNAIALSRDIIQTTDGKFGLATWATINPKNVRDKIYYVLHESGAPLHFTEITKRIREHSFDSKKIVQPTVHNELIADDRFVLVGRGIYALSHWGYKPGTVEEVIEEVLKKAKKPLTTDEIVAAVLKSRHVKKNTIVINLQIKPQFVKVGKKLYTITPANKAKVSADAKEAIAVAEGK